MDIKDVLERLKVVINDEDYIILPKDALLEFINEYLELKKEKDDKTILVP